MARPQTKSFVKLHTSGVAVYVNMYNVTGVMELKVAPPPEFPLAKAVVGIVDDARPLYVDETAEEIIYGQGNSKGRDRNHGRPEKRSEDQGDSGQGDSQADGADT